MLGARRRCRYWRTLVAGCHLISSVFIWSIVVGEAYDSWNRGLRTEDYQRAYDSSVCGEQMVFCHPRELTVHRG
jgi:hypothetical protein